MAALNKLQERTKEGASKKEKIKNPPKREN